MSWSDGYAYNCWPLPPILFHSIAFFLFPSPSLPSSPSGSQVAWEHEHFSRRKVPAATLSSLPPSRPTALFAHAGGLADSR